MERYIVRMVSIGSDKPSWMSGDWACSINGRHGAMPCDKRRADAVLYRLKWESQGWKDWEAEEL
jgi:hypothetical protein